MARSYCSLLRVVEWDQYCYNRPAAGPSHKSHCFRRNSQQAHLQRRGPIHCSCSHYGGDRCLMEPFSHYYFGGQRSGVR